MNICELNDQCSQLYRDLKSSKTRETYHWQSEQSRCFCVKPAPQLESEYPSVVNRGLSSGVMKTKQFGTFVTNCHPILEVLESSSTNLGIYPISFATQIVRSQRRTQEEINGFPLDPKLVGDAIKEELLFMWKLQIYNEFLVSYLDKSRLKAMALHEQK